MKNKYQILDEIEKILGKKRTREMLEDALSAIGIAVEV